jgi:hypothetical protein
MAKFPDFTKVMMSPSLCFLKSASGNSLIAFMGLFIGLDPTLPLTGESVFPILFAPGYSACFVDLQPIVLYVFHILTV